METDALFGPLKANKTLHLPAFFLAKGSAFASGDVPESLLAEEFFAKAMMQARQEIALPFELRAGLELACIWIGRGEVRRAHDLIRPVDRKSRRLNSSSCPISYGVLCV